MILSLLTAASAQSAPTRAQALFTSIKTNETIVRVHEQGRISFVLCPAPTGTFPDFSFSVPGATDHCRALPGSIADTPEALAAFGAEFEQVVHQHAAEAASTGQVVLRATATGIGFAAGFAAYGVGFSALAKRFGLNVPVRDFGRFSAQVGAALGALIIGSEMYRRREVARAEREFDNGRVTRVAVADGQPIAVSLPMGIFSLLEDYLVTALRRAAPAPQK